MITFKTSLHLKYYFATHWHRLFGSWFGKIYFPLAALLIILDIGDGFTSQSWTLIGVVLFLLLGLPAIKFLLARFYHKAQYMEYFFGPESFGYSVGSWKIEVKKDQIKTIVVKASYLKIKLHKLTLYAAAEPEIIKQVKNELLVSEYKSLVVEK